MVVVLAGSAAAVEGLAGVRADHVDLAALGHLAELGVDGGQTHALSPCPQTRMDLLGGGEAWRQAQGLCERTALPCHPHRRRGDGGHAQIVTVLILRYGETRTGTIPDKICEESADEMKSTSVAFVLLLGLLVSSCASSASGRPAGRLSVVAAESPWGAVASAIGGRDARVISVVRDPGVDPHQYTAGAAVAAEVATAGVVVDNGLGYDDFMSQLLGTGATGPRRVVTAADVLRVHAADANPHLWYWLDRVPRVARAIEEAMAAADPPHRAAYRANLRSFDASMATLNSQVLILRAHLAGTPVAQTERVAGYLLAQLGLRLVSPIGFSTAIENGTEPSAADAAAMNVLLDRGRAATLIYNTQTISPATQATLAAAKRGRVPVVGMSETVTPPAASFVGWQRAQIRSLAAALRSGRR